MNQKNYLLVLLTYIGMLLSTVLIPLALVQLYDYDLFNTTIYTNIVAFIIGAIIILFLLKDSLRTEREENPLPFRVMLVWIISGVFLSYGGQMIANVIEMTVLGIKPGSENTELIVKLTQMNMLFLLLPAIVGPIIEELVFRKVIFGSLRRRMNIHVAATISALIFAFFHLDFDHILIYFVMGLVFTFLYVKTKRIIVPIVVHMIMNTLAVLVQMLIDPEELQRMIDELQFIFLGGWF